MVGMASVLAFLYPTANPPIDYVVVFDGTNDHITKWNTGLLGPQPSESSLATTQASAPYQTYITPAAVDQRARDAASDAVVNEPHAVYKGLRGAAAVLVDEINALRQWEMSFKAAVAAATSLADLKTSVAALPNLPDRTLAQAKSAIQTKITTGVAD